MKIKYLVLIIITIWTLMAETQCTPLLDGIDISKFMDISQGFRDNPTNNIEQTKYIRDSIENFLVGDRNEYDDVDEEDLVSSKTIIKTVVRNIDETMMRRTLFDLAKRDVSVSSVGTAAFLIELNLVLLTLKKNDVFMRELSNIIISEQIFFSPQKTDIWKRMIRLVSMTMKSIFSSDMGSFITQQMNNLTMSTFSSPGETDDGTTTEDKSSNVRVFIASTLDLFSLAGKTYALSLNKLMEKSTTDSFVYSYYISDYVEVLNKIGLYAGYLQQIIVKTT